MSESHAVEIDNADKMDVKSCITDCDTEMRKRACNKTLLTVQFNLIRKGKGQHICQKKFIPDVI
ncbi:hypothetical protein DPMN_118892 [Dreissena polymorpha]|uniref:Uncharacterized protein n=1 Tax=Dreissena polymorpha TaxID=45954 RepID=A0A9D4GHN7_DREPO|nr:hypothetical protein DPMN_118892 [Dreissena polymorpha]